MATKAEATIEDLYNAPDDAMYELVDGKLVHMPPTGFLPSRVAGEIFVALRDYARQIGQWLCDDLMASPISSICRIVARSARMLPSRASAPENRMRFVDGAPLFAAEVRSEGDYGNAARPRLSEPNARITSPQARCCLGC